MKIEKELKLRDLRTIQLGSHFGLPAARLLRGGVVRASFLGPGAEKRVWKRFRDDVSDDLASSKTPDLKAEKPHGRAHH